MLKVLGWLCYAFGALDLILFYFCDTDLTGVSWSPWAAFIVGAVLCSLGKND